jgi:hypothetical protein
MARTVGIHAPSEKIFQLIEDFHLWSRWSPWEQLGDNLKKTCFGPASAGEGRMEITDTSFPSSAVIRLDFIRPMEGHHNCRVLRL